MVRIISRDEFKIENMDKLKLLEMKIEDLSCFPNPDSATFSFPLPEGYSFRMYTPGDEKEWIRVQDEADDYTDADENLFNQEFGSHRSELPRRMAFLKHGDRVIGSATAWIDDINGDPVTGRLHWVAIVPEYQGRNLAAPLTYFTLSLFPALNCSRAYLLTNAVRIPAISLYLKIGFKPVIGNPEEQCAWEEILGIIESLRM